MFFLFFPLPFSVNSVPSALASVKNKISLTMRSPPCLASVPSPAASAPLFSCQGRGTPLLPVSGYPFLLPCSSPCPGRPSLAWGGCGRRRDEAWAGRRSLVRLCWPHPTCARVCVHAGLVHVGVSESPGGATW